MLVDTRISETVDPRRRGAVRAPECRARARASSPCGGRTTLRHTGEAPLEGVEALRRVPETPPRRAQGAGRGPGVTVQEARLAGLEGHGPLWCV